MLRAGGLNPYPTGRVRISAPRAMVPTIQSIQFNPSNPQWGKSRITNPGYGAGLTQFNQNILPSPKIYPNPSHLLPSTSYIQHCVRLLEMAPDNNVPSFTGSGTVKSPVDLTKVED